MAGLPMPRYNTWRCGSAQDPAATGRFAPMAWRIPGRERLLRLGHSPHQCEQGMFEVFFGRDPDQQRGPCCNWTSRAWRSWRGPVVRAGIRALHAGRASVVPGFNNKAAVAMVGATPRWLH